MLVFSSSSCSSLHLSAPVAFPAAATTNTIFTRHLLRVPPPYPIHLTYSAPVASLSSISSMESKSGSSSDVSDHTPTSFGFISRKTYSPPSWASRLRPAPSHVFSLGHVFHYSLSIYNHALTMTLHIYPDNGQSDTSADLLDFQCCLHGYI